MIIYIYIYVSPFSLFLFLTFSLSHVDTRILGFLFHWSSREAQNAKFGVIFKLIFIKRSIFLKYLITHGVPCYIIVKCYSILELVIVSGKFYVIASATGRAKCRWMWTVASSKPEIQKYIIAHTSSSFFKYAHFSEIFALVISKIWWLYNFTRVYIRYIRSRGRWSWLLLFCVIYFIVLL